MEERLYWCEFENLFTTGEPRGSLFRYDPATGDHERVYAGDFVGGFTVQSDGSLLLFSTGGRVMTWKDGRIRQSVQLPLSGEGPAVRFNDVVADPVGRVFCGTRYDDRQGSLHRLDTDGSVARVVAGVGESNGLGFTPDCQGLYYTDSEAREITLFDYDQDHGRLSHSRPFGVLDEDEEGLPDGLAVDADGALWSARAFGGCVVRYTSAGREDRRIDVPVGLTTSVAFGGPDAGTLYITTGGGQDKGEFGEHAGALFSIDLAIGGRAPFRSRVDLG